jgi:decaprenylphospho-beta-D-erythro-pentofuranosid-2-ulose 2-reductase
VTAIVVGASAGLGRALAGALAAAGYDLVVVASDSRDVDALAADLRIRHEVRVVALGLDLGRAGVDLEPLTRAADALGGADQLLLPIGWTAEAAHDDATLDPDTAERLLRTNFLSVAAVVARFLPALRCRHGARVVGFGSVAAARGRRANLVYASAKRALQTYFEGLRHACADTPLRVQFWVPGYLDTNLAFGRNTPLARADPARFVRRVVARLGDGDFVVYYPRWWRPLCAAARLAPWVLFKRLKT